MQLIKLLMTTFTKVGINVIQSSGDADVMICKKALQLAEHGNSVEVAGKDTDLLVILVHQWKQEMKLFFRTTRKESNKRKAHEKTMWWSIEKIATGESLEKLLLFAHIWSGCDTTSAIHGQGMFPFILCVVLYVDKCLCWLNFLKYNLKANNASLFQCKSYKVFCIFPLRKTRFFAF